MRRYVLLLLPLLVLAACQTEPAADAETMATAYDVYGEAFDDAGAVPVEAVVAEPDAYVGQAVTMEGRVSEVCQMAGCWLTFQTLDGQNVRIVVPREEEGGYVFTVPKDLSGRRAVVHGTLDAATVSEHMQHHYAEDADPDADPDEHPADHTDADADADAAAGPKPELHLTATGVLVEKATT